MKRGEIWHVDLNPAKGTEQQGRRYVLIVSADEFNKASGRAVVAPITTGGAATRNKGFAVSLTGAGTGVSGIVLCNQVRILDLRSRSGRKIEDVPDFIIDEVLARIAPIFE